MVSTITDAVELVESICHLPKIASRLRSAERRLRSSGLKRAIATHDTAYLYGALMEVFSFQGISDAIAAGYIDRYGNANWVQLAETLASPFQLCPKLESFEAYHKCGFRKSARTCSRPELLEACPVSRLALRKGDLNQLAFSLFLFLRDNCQGDLVAFIDTTLAEAQIGTAKLDIDLSRQGLMRAFSPIYSIGPKLISLGLANLLMAGGRQRPHWVAVGRSMVVVDSLVHNFLHRTGILAAYGSAHAYGPSCYGKKGCEIVVRDIAARIDLKLIAPALPSHHPRLVQTAIWRFCAELGLDICNGRNIADINPCSMADCPVGHLCSRTCLRPPQIEPAPEPSAGGSASGMRGRERARPGRFYNWGRG